MVNRARVRAMACAIGACAALAAGGTWLAAGADGPKAATVPQSKAIAPTSKNPFLLDHERAVARENVDGTEYVIAPLVGDNDPGRLCFSVMRPDGFQSAGCGRAGDLTRSAVLFVQHSPESTRVWAYVPNGAAMVVGGGRVIADDTSRFFSAIVPEGVEKLAVTSASGESTLRVPPRPQGNLDPRAG